jgi:hypothetical protein
VGSIVYLLRDHHAGQSRFNWTIGAIIAAWVTTISTQAGTTSTILFHR